MIEKTAKYLNTITKQTSAYCSLAFHIISGHLYRLRLNKQRKDPDRKRKKMWMLDAIKEDFI